MNPGMIIISALVAVFLLFINGCNGLFSFPTQAASITYHGPLKVALHEDLVQKSLEKDLISSFARTHAIKLNFVSFKNINQAEKLLNSEKVDLVFTRMALKNTDFNGHYSIAYDDLKLAVVCSGDFRGAKELYLPERYFSISQKPNFNEKFRNLHWTKTTLSNVKIKKLALEKTGVCFLTDSRLANKDVLNYPALRKVWTAKKADSVSWITRHDLKELNQLFHAWFQSLVRQNQIRKFWDQYEAVAFKMSALEHRRFQKDIQNKLPQWRRLFEKAAKKNDIPWTLLAAVSYQESKWDNEARSYTGVRGLMQITSNTAKHLGIEDREDPIQSIDGGAYYLKYLYNKTPAHLSNYERWAQALAGYNIGWAHIRDARKLSKTLNLDFNRWIHMKKVLPLLSDSNYHKDLKFGFARGQETVDFVDQVFGYTELLDTSFTRPLQTSLDF